MLKYHVIHVRHLTHREKAGIDFRPQSVLFFFFFSLALVSIQII